MVVASRSFPPPLLSNIFRCRLPLTSCFQHINHSLPPPLYSLSSTHFLNPIRSFSNPTTSIFITLFNQSSSKISTEPSLASKHWIFHSLFYYLLSSPNSFPWKGSFFVLFWCTSIQEWWSAKELMTFLQATSAENATTI